MKLVTFEVELRVETPLHIGTGEELEPDADFTVETGPGGSRIARIVDVDAALADMSDSELVTATRSGMVAAAIGAAKRAAVTVDTLPVVGAGNVTRTRALHRTLQGEPYIPGSTLKGSIRTSWLRKLLRVDLSLLEHVRGQRVNDARRAGERLEGEALAVTGLGEPEPTRQNRDLLRVLRVSDFHPRGRATCGFYSIAAHRVHPAGHRQSSPIPIWCESVVPGAIFAGTITIESDSTLANRGRAQLGAIGRHDGDIVVPALLEPEFGNLEPFQRHALLLLATWWEECRHMASDEVAALEGLAKANKAALRRLAGLTAVTLGWGTGWRTKTIGTSLTPADLTQLVERYRTLKRWRSRGFPGDFPVTRKLVLQGGSLVQPGWCTVSSIRAR